MKEPRLYAEVRACLERIDLSKPEAVHDLVRVQLMLEAMNPPDDETGTKILLMLRNAAQNLHDDLVLIHRGGKE